MAENLNRVPQVLKDALFTGAGQGESAIARRDVVDQQRAYLSEPPPLSCFFCRA
jgi:hypothetical protein